MAKATNKVSTAAKDEGASPTHIVVRARDERGFRRAGRYWPPVETTVSIDEFTEEQISALSGEPELEVTFIVADDKAE